jgi:succinylglutamate desuccinylase
MSQSIYTFKGELPGPTVVIMGGVHGNEPGGVIAINKLLPGFSIKRGKVHFVIANLKAIELNVRETEMNMNRAFKDESLLTEPQKKSYERLRALEIMPYLDESDALLDIHSSSTMGSIPFVICEPHSFEVASRLPFSIVSNGWDKIHPGGTDYYMNKKGGMGICIECGYHLDKEAPDIAENSIMTFLTLMNLIDGVIPSKNSDQKHVHAYYVYHTVDDFKLVRKFDDFEEIKKGILIGTDGSLEINASEDGVIIFARNISGGNESFVFARLL